MAFSVLPALQHPEAKGRDVADAAARSGVRHLRDAILDGRLEPGEQLKDAEIAEWLGLSRTPIREALARLEDYGLVRGVRENWLSLGSLIDQTFEEEEDS